MKILAIDQATNCGWCCGPELYGVWKLNVRSDESAGMKWIRFRSKLKEIVEAEKIELIAFERIAGRHANSLIHAAKLVGIIEVFCIENNIEHASFPAPEVKKFATGKGNAGKPEMIRAAREKYGYPGKDDNEADAIHIYHLAKSLYGG